MTINHEQDEIESTQSNTYTFLKSNYKYKRRYSTNQESNYKSCNEKKLHTIQCANNAIKSNKTQIIPTELTIETTTTKTDAAVEEVDVEVRRRRTTTIATNILTSTECNSINKAIDKNTSTNGKKSRRYTNATTLKMLLLIMSNLQQKMMHHYKRDSKKNRINDVFNIVNKPQCPRTKKNLQKSNNDDVNIDIDEKRFQRKEIDAQVFVKISTKAKCLSPRSTTEAETEADALVEVDAAAAAAASEDQTKAAAGSFVLPTARLSSSTTSLTPSSIQTTTSSISTLLSTILPLSTLCGVTRINDKIFTFLTILFIIFTLCARNVAGGICWQTALGSGKCNNTYSLNITRAECCGRNPEFSFTERDPSEIEYFFATAIGGGMECLPCTDSCKSIECAVNKKCVKRKGRPKCICAPECGAAARRRRQQHKHEQHHEQEQQQHQRNKVYRGHLHHSEQLPRDIRSLSSEITNFNSELVTGGNVDVGFDASNMQHRNQNQRKTIRHQQKEKEKENEKEKQEQKPHQHQRQDELEKHLTLHQQQEQQQQQQNKQRKAQRKHHYQQQHQQQQQQHRHELHQEQNLQLIENFEHTDNTQTATTTSEYTEKRKHRSKIKNNCQSDNHKNENNNNTTNNSNNNNNNDSGSGGDGNFENCNLKKRLRHSHQRITNTNYGNDAEQKTTVTSLPRPIILNDNESDNVASSDKHQTFEERHEHNEHKKKFQRFNQNRQHQHQRQHHHLHPHQRTHYHQQQQQHQRPHQDQHQHQNKNQNQNRQTLEQEEKEKIQQEMLHEMQQFLKELQQHHQTTLTMLTLPVNGATSFLPSSSLASTYNATTGNPKIVSNANPQHKNPKTNVQTGTPVNSTTSLSDFFALASAAAAVAADRHRLLNRGSVFTTSSSQRTLTSLLGQQHQREKQQQTQQQQQQQQQSSTVFKTISKAPSSSSSSSMSAVESPDVRIVGVDSSTSPTLFLSTSTSAASTDLSADLALFHPNEFSMHKNPKMFMETIQHTSHPVCGTDGRTYNSECQLKKRACRTNNVNLKVAYRGHCRNSCKNVQCLDGLMCVEDQNMISHCIVCKIQCPQDEDTFIDDYERTFTKKTSQNNLSHRFGIDPSRAVCGVDGKTYRSTCDINSMICKIGRAIAIAYPGPCRADRITCNDINCGPKHKCLVDLLTHEPRCVSCSYKCSRKHHPTALRYEEGKICGVNNRTYSSWCEMRKDSCTTGFFIDVKAAGKCQ